MCPQLLHDRKTDVLTEESFTIKSGCLIVSFFHVGLIEENNVWEWFMPKALHDGTLDQFSPLSLAENSLKLTCICAVALLLFVILKFQKKLSATCLTYTCLID